MDELQKEWPVIERMPLAFVIAVLVSAGIIWAAAMWLHRNQLTDLKERIALKDDEIGRLKNAAVAADNRLLQHGAEVGTATGAHIDLANKTAVFGQLNGGPLFDQSKEFEFRGSRMRILRAAMETHSHDAHGNVYPTLVSATCEIV
jgi:hypothetical protein